MKIGIIGANVGGPEAAKNLVTVAEKADEVGLESFWTYEHAMIPAAYASVYPYHPSGKLWGAPETHWVDPFITLAHIAGRTKHLQLGTGVNILPQANPLLFAKQAASLDYLSGGRLMLGVGAGWLKEEFDAMGVPFERRGKRFDDYLTAMGKVWSGEVVEHQSEWVSWSGFKSYPLPVQKPHPPIIIGGVTPPAIRRAVAHGDGWFAVGNAKGLQQPLALLAETAKEAGRPLESIEVTAVWFYHREGPDSWQTYRDLGLSRLLIPYETLDKENLRGEIEKIGDQVISKI